MKFFKRNKETDMMARQERDTRVLRRELHEAELRRLAGGVTAVDAAVVDAAVVDWEPPAVSGTN